jgi:hypothetical protein
VLKRNILKLKYMALPEELREEKSRKEMSPQSNLTKMQKTSRMQSRSKSRSSSVMGVMTPRRNIPQKSKFNVLSTAIQWLTSRHEGDNPDLALAEKLVKSSVSTTSIRSSNPKHHRDTKNDFKIAQAKCKFQLRRKFFAHNKTKFYSNSDDNSNPTSKHSNMEGSYRQLSAR